MRLAKLLALLAIVQLIGGHWAALQSVAWLGMVASYTRADPLSVAIEKTLDGDHPCGLCEVVKSGRAEEQKQTEAKVVVKLNAVLSPVAGVPAPPCAGWKYSKSAARSVVWRTPPPTPPPLAA